MKILSETKLKQTRETSIIVLTVSFGNRRWQLALVKSQSVQSDAVAGTDIYSYVRSRFRYIYGANTTTNRPAVEDARDRRVIEYRFSPKPLKNPSTSLDGMPFR